MSEAHQAAESDRIRQLEAQLREAEQRQALLSEGVKDFAVFSMDVGGRITWWGEGARRLLGYQAEDVLGQYFSMFFTPEDRAGGLPERELLTATAVGSAADENWVVRKDGSRLWASGFSAPQQGDNGGLTGFIKIFRDLTERRRADEALREGDLRLRAALAAADMGTWLWQVPTDKQTLDENLHRLMGVTGDRTIHNLDDFLALIHPEDQEQVKVAFLRSVREGVNLLVEFRVVGLDGSVRWLRDKGEAFRDEQGRVQYLTGACVDITDRKTMEDQMREEAFRKDEFLAMLGHELRNPLAPLRNVIETLRRRPHDGQEQPLAMMARQVAHLSRLVDDLLDVSRITRGLIELHKEPVALAEVAAQAVEMVNPAVDARGHELSVALPHKPLHVNGDATRLTQVIFNLLNNAAKYTDPGGRLWLTVERAGEQAVVRVRDNGRGMTPELVPKVFDMFIQGQRSLDRSQGGLGLGLTLVKRLVELHGGTVAAQSAGPGQGSEFVVRLPAFRMEAKPPPRQAVQAAVQINRILVVDDNPDVAESLGMILEGLAREIRMAHSGAKALELASEFKPQVVLCDIGMPGMDGYETARRLRQLPGFDKVVLAAVSGYGQEEDRKRSLEAGFDRLLVKPVGRATLEELIKTAANRG